MVKWLGQVVGSEVEDLSCHENKGLNAFETPDSIEKRAVGELWANASGGRCFFVMATDQRWSMIEEKIAQAA